MIRGRTQQIGARTRSAGGSRHSSVSVSNKDPNFDYSFRRVIEIEQGGGVDMQGYSIVDAATNTGETISGPKTLASRGRGKKQLGFMDVVLAKRPKADSGYYQSYENERYNAQQQLVLHAAKRAKVALRNLDSGSIVENQSTGLEKAFKQRPGPTMEE
jgi:hypothetical protein